MSTPIGDTKMATEFVWAGELYDDGSRNDKWVCNDLFISKRDFFNGYEREHYQVYRAIEGFHGRMPWTVNNRRLTDKPIFGLGEAIKFASEHLAHDAS